MGSKWQLIENLDIVANKMRTARPRSILLNPDKPIPHQAVLKRTHSESSKHVLLLDNPNRNWDHLKNHSEIPGSRWFAQTYVPQLETAGEWRVLMVNGKSLYVVHTLPNTKKGTWQRELVYNYYSLKELT
jgi:glutathione synthase/RimK-type ligase-like ATP-grasp enzyme